MNLRTLVVLLVATCLQLFAGGSSAQTYSYHVYIDTDLRSDTGCLVAGGGQTFAGADYRLTATVTGSPPTVTARTLSNCAGGGFAPGTGLSASYPVGLNNGLPLAGGSTADVIELSVARSQVLGAVSFVRVGFAAESASGSSDVLYTADGTANGAPIAIGSPLLIPTLGVFGALLLAVALAVLARRSLKQHRQMAQILLVGALISVGFAAWAANHVADGQVGDWASETPRGMDAIGDSVPPLAGTDIVAVFGAEEGPNLHFRIDVVDAENRPPMAVNDSYSTLEDQALTVAAPGVLGNDSDPDGNPITAQLVTGPTRGTLVLNPNGGFSYTPNANANGADSFSYNTFDSQVASMSAATVSITVSPVNDVPVFTAGPSQTVLEDAGAQTVSPWATGIDDGDPEVVQALTFNITGNTNAALFSVAPAVSATGVLTYTPAADANGVATITLNLMDNGGTANGGVDTSGPQSFTITVTAVNDAPTFTASNPPTVLEDAAPVSIPAWATFSPGPADESGQTVLGYQISAISNAALFSAAPAVANNGTLTYALAANANGSSTFTVRVQDSGGTANGGIDLSSPQTFTVTVTPVNDVPSFVAGPNQTVLEDAGPQTVNPWATAINDGDPEVVQALTFNVTGNTNPALFSAGPAISATGVLTYTPAANANGVATITLNLMDNGGTANGGIDTSGPQSFTITVTAVNDAPSFVAGANPTVAEDAGAQTLANWATAISAGPPDEAGQTLSFVLSGNTNPGLFSAAPAISPTGTLTYTSAANANGVASITVRLMDNGGTANGGVDISAPQTLTITVTAVNDAPVNTVPGIQNTGDTVPLVLSTANTNAISVVDVDAAAGIIQMSFGTGAPANGTLTLANPGSVLTTLTGNGTSQVIATGTLTALNTALNGPGGSLTYTPVLGTSAARTITVISNDQGNTGAGGALMDTDTITVNVDAAPVVTSVPVNGATTANNVAVTVNFSESVNVIAGITLTCGGPNLITGGSTGAGVTSLNLAYTAPLPSGSCTLFVPAASVSDVDTIDPPNNPVADYSATFTVDAAPAFVSSTPAAAAVVANTAVFSALFSEPVNFGMGGFTLNCGGPIAVTPSGSGTNTLTFTPTAALPNGAACTATLIAANITDVDSFDPPDNLPANVVVNFSVDAAPTFVSAIPAAAAVVGTGQVVSFTFDEPVNNLGTAITLNCGAAVPGTIGGSGTATLTFTPSAPLPAGANCTATAVAVQIGDVDTIDPPQNPLADVVRSFSVDAAPSVLSTVPASGALLQSPSGTITINFSESVNFDTTANAANTSFDLECPAATPVNFTVTTASPASSVVIDPDDTAIAGQTCTLTIRAAFITDVDAADPPDTMVADVTVTIGYDDPAIANDDSYLVTPHLTLAIDSGVQGGRVLANDTVGSAVITGFGPVGTCGAAVPNGSNFITTAGGGRVVLNLNGSFSYAPPASLVGNGLPASPEDGFCYTLTGGDTADVGFEIALTELVWHIDGSYAGGSGTADGTQARPFTALVGAGQFATAGNAGGTANDTIFIRQGTYACHLDLGPGQRLVGDGASATTLQALSGVTPVAGSAHSTFTGVRPLLQSAGNDCITLGTDNLLRGFNVGNSARDIVGNAFLGLDARQMSLSGTGQALELVDGVINISLDSVTANNSPSHGLNVDNVTGQLLVLGATVVDTTPAGGAGVRINASTGFFQFGAISVDRRGSAGLLINASNNVNMGGVTINNQNSSNTSAIAIDNTPVGGSVFLSQAFVNNNGSSSSAAAISGNAGTVTINSGTLDNANGATLSISSGSGTINVAAIVTNSVGRAVQILNNTGGTITLSANINHTVGEGVVIQNNANTTINLSGATKAINSAANGAVVLITNAGSTINFTGGGLDIDTTSGTGFSATGGGTVSVQGAGNSVFTTTGTAVNVSGVTIGAGGMTFERIDSTTASANQAISLTNTGAGAFTVTGTGAAGSGGTISNKTDDAIRLDTVGGLVTLNRMIIEDIGNMAGAFNTVTGHNGIQGVNVNGGMTLVGTTIRRISDNAIHGGIDLAPTTATVWNGLSLDGVLIEDTNRFHIAGVGDANNEGSVRIVGLRGTVSVTNSTFQRGAEFLDLFVTAGTLNMTVTANSFTNAYKEFTSGALASVGGHCIDVVVQGAGVGNVTIGSRTVPALANSFLNCRVASLRFVNDNGATGNSDFIVARNTFTVNDGSSGIGGDYDFPQGGVLAWNLGNGAGGSVVDAIIENNVFTDVSNASGGIGQLSLIAEGGLVQASVQSNSFVRPGNAPMWVLSRNSAASNMRLSMANNTVTGGPSLCTTDPSCAGGYSTPGLRTLFDTNNGGVMDLTLDNNQFAGHDQGFDPGETVEIRGLIPGGGTTCANLTNNSTDDGYSLEPQAGTIRTVGAGTCSVGGPSVDCQNVLGSRNNRGGGNSLLTNPPFVRVTNNPVTVNGTLCAVPTGSPFP